MRKTGDAEIDEQLLRFGRNIREARERAGLSQDRLGLDRAAISFLERAERSPDLPTIVRVAHAVGVKPAALLDGMGVEEAPAARGPRLAAGSRSDPAGRFGANLQWARQRSGISQEALAIAAAVDRAAISVFENGHRDPNLRTILKLARALALAPAALLRGIEADGAPLKNSTRLSAQPRA
jgi:transcriptional regulator with XRE-family HTH domain